MAKTDNPKLSTTNDILSAQERANLDDSIDADMVSENTATPINDDNLQAKLEKKYHTRKEAYIVEQAPSNTNIKETDQSFLDGTDLVSFVKATLSDLITNRGSYTDRMCQASNYRDGDFSNSILNNLPDGQLQVTANQINTFVDLKKAAILGSRCNIVAVPLDDSALDLVEQPNVFSASGDPSQVSTLRKIDTIQGFADGLWKKNHNKELFHLTADDVVVKGTAIVLATYGPTAFSGTSMYQNKHDINFKVIDPRKILNDPTAHRQDLSDSRFIYTFDMIPEIELMRNPSFAKLKKQIDDTNMGTNSMLISDDVFK